MMRLARRALARVSRMEAVRALVFPLLRRSPALAMAVNRLLQAARAGSPSQGGVLAAAPPGSRDLGEAARKVLADLTRSPGIGISATLAQPPRVALVSPLPPQRSGVAHHAAGLARQLRGAFDLVLVTDAPKAGSFDGIPLHPPDWLLAHAAGFDAIVYQLGNSRAHEFAFELLERQPGIAVMHDLYISNFLEERERSGVKRNAFVRALYESHGWPALGDLAREGREAAAWRYPASLHVLQRATRVIVHSAHAREEIRRWWGEELAARCDVVPLLREAGHRPERTDARRRLGIAQDDFVVASFGLLGATKCNTELLEAFLGSALADDARCRLVFVGENVPNAYGSELNRRIATHGKPASVKVTGFVDPPDYASWLSAADVAVQLRTRSRGETSAAVLDALAHGLPTIVNAHGSAGELPDPAVLKLPDAFAVTELSSALERMWKDAALRLRLSEAAAAHVRETHGAARVGAAYAASIATASTSPVADYVRRVQSLGPQSAGWSKEELAREAARIASQLPRAGPGQLFVDVSALAKTDLGTGIQRVVKRVLREWLAASPAGWRIEPVSSEGHGAPWRHARTFASELAGVPGLRMEETVIEPRAGDVFLGLDLHTALVPQNEALLLDMRKRGVKVVFAVYDLLPIRMPHAFPAGTDGYFERWLQAIAKVSDGVVAISRASAEDFVRWLDERRPHRDTPLAIGHFALGADIDAAQAGDLTAAESRQSENATSQPALLMVGTLEPRKGHAQALDAMEILWRKGVGVHLVIAGKAGWMNDELARRLRRHAQRGKRLFWFANASDALLAQLYRKCAGLLAASQGEGFGLPLVEAARQGLPLVARDIPVFRELAGDHAFYFDGGSAVDLARDLERWLALRAAGQHPKPGGIAWSTWSASAKSLEDVVLGDGWFRRWSG